MPDHSPISTRMLINKDDNVNRICNKGNFLKLNTSLLKDPNNKEAIGMVTFLSKLCNQFVRPVKQWCHLVESWKKTYQIIGKKVVKDKNEEENDLQFKLNEAEFAFQNCPNDPVLLKNLVFIKHQ